MIVIYSVQLELLKFCHRELLRHILMLWKKSVGFWFEVHHILALDEIFATSIRSIWLNTLNYFWRVWSFKRNKNGRSLFIWQGEIHPSWPSTAIGYTTCDKYCTRCGCGCEVHIFGDFHHIQVVTIPCHTAFFEGYSTSSGTSAISPSSFLLFYLILLNIF